MAYIFETGKPRRVMHLARFSSSGTLLLAALCGIEHRFNRTINEPWGLGRKVCKRCKRVRSAEGVRDE